MEYTTIYKVYGYTADGKPILWAEFLDLKLACQYAVANYGKIHPNLPEVEKTTYVYDPEFKVVHSDTVKIGPELIYYMNKI